MVYQLPLPAVPGNGGHSTDHNLLRDSIDDVNNRKLDDVTAVLPVVVSGTGVTRQISAPTALTASDLIAGVNIDFDQVGRTITINSIGGGGTGSITNTDEIVSTFDGTVDQTSGTIVSQPIGVLKPFVVKAVRLSAITAPTGEPIRIDVKKSDGNSIFSNPQNVPRLSVGKKFEGTVISGTISVSANDYITIHILNTTGPFSVGDLSVAIEIEYLESQVYTKTQRYAGTAPAAVNEGALEVGNIFTYNSTTGKATAEVSPNPGDYTPSLVLTSRATGTAWPANTFLKWSNAYPAVQNFVHHVGAGSANVVRMGMDLDSAVTDLYTRMVLIIPGSSWPSFTTATSKAIFRTRKAGDVGHARLVITNTGMLQIIDAQTSSVVVVSTVACPFNTPFVVETRITVGSGAQIWVRPTLTDAPVAYTSASVSTGNFANGNTIAGVDWGLPNGEQLSTPWSYYYSHVAASAIGRLGSIV